MELRTQMDPLQAARAHAEANAYNNKLRADGIKIDKDMGQDKYLKLLVTQLRYQDPTNPLQNHEFAAQMAQFSALEQMTKLNGTVEKMLGSAQSSRAHSFLGKEVEWLDGETQRSQRGIVRSLGFADGNAVLLVGDRKVDPADVVIVSMPEAPSGAQSGASSGASSGTAGRTAGGTGEGAGVDR
jgi:flagellar basal-body rod modification protein FlgD